MDELEIQNLESLNEADATGIKVKLDQFEGPLDLLLQLIKNAKIDIHEIFISKITEQYLEIMKDIENLDVEKASDFIDMAATLIEIKSKKLLPKPEIIDENAEDPEQKLIRQLEEYKIFKEASEKLKQIEDVDKFFKEPEKAASGFRYELGDLSFEKLIDAFSMLMHKVSAKSEEIQEKKIVKDRFTVAQKIAQIKDGLLKKKRFMFSELFDEDYSKSEIINTFLALLELLKNQMIIVNQPAPLGDIEIVKKEEAHG